MNIKFIVIVAIVVFIGLMFFGYIKMNVWLIFGLPIVLIALVLWLMFFSEFKRSAG